MKSTHLPSDSHLQLHVYLLTVLSLSLVALPCNSKEQAAVSPGRMPRPSHVVIVVEENKSYKQIIDNTAAPYINALAKKGALFTNSFAIAHPSQPNYLALFSGSTHGIEEQCPLSLSGDNLATALKGKGLSFAIYSESMPSIGYTGCGHGDYSRKHNPVPNWSTNTSPGMSMPFSMFPANYETLPTIAIVVPNQLNDMHDGAPLAAIIRGDRWLRDNITSYLTWAKTHNALLVLTWDEDDDFSGNHIATIFAGPMVASGSYSNRIDHLSVLRTLEDMYGLTLLGQTGQAQPIRDIWK